MRAIWGGLAAGALASVGYSFYETRLYHLETHALAFDRPIPPLEVLHLSDTHLVSRKRSLIRFLEQLPDQLARIPDIVVATGDLIQDESGIEVVVRALNAVDARLGKFYVLGSHDYYQSNAANYIKYFTGRRELMKDKPLPTDELKRGLGEKGWIDLTNTTHELETADGKIRVTGVDDPYIGREQTDHIQRQRGEALAIGLLHSPDVVSEYVLHGFDLVLAGHTHGGQVRVPGVGAIVTNCTLPSGLACGAHRVGRTWLHVSQGLGNGKFSPIRFNCRPQATLLRLRS